MFETYPEIMKIHDLQEALGIGRSAAYKLINHGDIKHLRIGNSIRIPRLSLLEFISGTQNNHMVTDDSS